MWTFLQCEELPEDQPPAAWLDCVLPRRREAYQSQHTRVHHTLEQASFDREATFFAADDRGPVGLIAITGEGPRKQVELVGVRGDRRRRGLGKALLERTIVALRNQGTTELIAPGVNSANTAAVRLLTALGFEGQPTGGIRMRRSLDGPLPPLDLPEGYTLRAMRPGEEEEWVRMRNDCFREEGDGNWTVENFRRGFREDPVFDFGRVFVLLQGDRMVGTSTAWEADFGEGPVGLVHWVGVEPGHRGKKLGIALTVRTLEELAARGFPDAWLNTGRKRVAAVRLYERLGFDVHRETYTYTLALTPERETHP